MKEMSICILKSVSSLCKTSSFSYRDFGFLREGDHPLLSGHLKGTGKHTGDLSLDRR